MHFLSTFLKIAFLSFPIFQVRNGHIKRITDNDIQSLVLEIVGTNVSTTYITCPADPKLTLGIKLPFLVMIVKNMKKYFTFEVMVRKNIISTDDHYLLNCFATFVSFVYVISYLHILHKLYESVTMQIFPSRCFPSL